MMETNKIRRFVRPKRMLTLVAVIAVLLSLAVAASATGMSQTIRMWINSQEVDAQSYMDEDGNIFVEATGDGSIEVICAEEGLGGTDIATILDVDTAYEYKNGRDYLCFTNTATGETQELDVTDKLVDGKYQDTLNVFGYAVAVDLTVDGESTGLNFSIEETPEP